MPRVKLLWCLLPVALLALTGAESPDPKLKLAADELRPIIIKLEDYQKKHDTYPLTLQQAGVDNPKTIGDMPQIGYMAETHSDSNGVDFAGPGETKKIIGYELYIDLSNGGLFYIHTDRTSGWFFNSGESRTKIDL